MTWYEALLLGLLQGATEFLPVSSSGHLVVGQSLLGVHLPGAGFEIVLHLATVLSVLLVYRARIGNLVTGAARRDPDQLRYAALLVLASVPAAVAGLGFGDFLESLFDRPIVAGAALALTGWIVWSARWALARGPERGVATGSAIVMGLAQAAAIVPGISRSGSTVVAALWHGVDPREAAAFSFLMSVPAVGGAAILKLPEMLGPGGVAGGEEVAGAAVAGAVAEVGGAAMVGSATGGAALFGVTAGTLLLAGAMAFVSGVAAVRVFRAMLDNRSFHLFAPYLWAVGGAFLVWHAVS